MLRHPILAVALLAVGLLALPTRGDEPKAGGAAGHAAPAAAAHADPGHGAAPAADPHTGPASKSADTSHGAGEASHGGGHGAGQPNILEAQAPLAIWTVVVFVVLLTVLGKYAWKPLLKALEAREEHLLHVLHDTEKARNDAERLLVENQKQLANAAEQARAVLEQARRDAEAAADTIVKKAQAEAEASRERAEREIATAKDQALDEIWTKTADLAVSVAGKVLVKELTPDDHRRLLDVAVAQLPSQNGQGARA